MGKGRFRLAVRAEFSAAHRLRNYKGKCEALHGHNFGVEILVEGETLDPETGMLVDFGDLKADLGRVLSLLDHADLNAVEPFIRANPSSENLARFIFRELAPCIQERGARLAQVTVSEKDAQCATYLETEP